MNIPNLLTILRFFLIPIFVFVFYSSSENNILYATNIFILAGITDVLDGYIARTYNMITKWGTVFDPLADKLMLVTVLICFTDIGFIPIWVISIVGLKEILMVVGGIFLYYKADKAVIPANRYGKIATVSFYVTILVVAFNLNKILSYGLISISVFLTLLAFVNYFFDFKSLQKIGD